MGFQTHTVWVRILDRKTEDVELKIGTCSFSGPCWKSYALFPGDICPKTILQELAMDDSRDSKRQETLWQGFLARMPAENRPNECPL